MSDENLSQSGDVVALLAVRVAALIDEEAERSHWSRTGLLRELIPALKDMVDDVYSDGRTVLWCCRARLYESTHPSDPVSDSDSQLDPDQPGTALVRSLPAVAAWGCNYARGYHNVPCVGLGKHQTTPVQNTRNMLSRRGDGTAFMTIPYETTRRTIGQSSRGAATMYMPLRIDIVRKTNTDERGIQAQLRKMPSITK